MTQRAFRSMSAFWYHINHFSACLHGTPFCFCYDGERYQTLQEVALAMLAVATAQERAMLEPLRTGVFARMCPVVGGNAAVIDAMGQILLLRRADTQQWVMPGGMMEVGETPAQAVVLETREETGYA
jgi:NADH pyrophosphatase NudC (nudix superfamily)